MRAIVLAILALCATSCGSSGSPALTGEDLQATMDTRDARDAGPDVRDPGQEATDLAAGTDLDADEPASDETSKDSDSTFDAPCPAGTQDCTGDNLRLCLEGAWSIVEPACAEGCLLGRCNACRPGVKRCKDATGVEVCGADGTGWQEINTCPCGGKCVEGLCGDACEGRACGDDGCGTVCGYCKAGQFCTVAGQCETCTCVGKVCGDSGCGETCGYCEVGKICTAGQCLKE